MSDQTAPEPTMEEILASIRRIISEDDAPQVEAAGDDEDEQEEAADESPAAAPEPEPEPVAAAPAPTPPPAPEPAARELRAYVKPTPPPPVTPPAPDAPLVSARAATVAASAFGQLSAAVSQPRQSQTLDELAREMLQPMLRKWLDDNLPRVVQAAVREEVERISRGRVG